MYLMFGREHILFKDYRDQNITNDDDASQIDDRIKHIQSLISVLHPSLVSELTERREQADAQLHDTHSLPPGTYVQLKRVRNIDKLTRRYQDIYKVVERTSEGNYVLETIRGRPMATPIHPDRLRVITPGIVTELLTNVEGRQQPSDNDDEDMVYEVEQITDHRVRKVGRRNVLEYQIKWVGYQDPTWEAEDHVYADECIAKYWDSIHNQQPQVLHEIREDQLMERLSDVLRYIPSKALQKWILHHTAMIDLDISPSQQSLSFCQHRLTQSLDSNDILFINSSSIWIDVQWRIIDQVEAWIINHCSNKRIYTLVPEWYSIPKEFKVFKTLPLPNDMLWFVHPDGSPVTRVPTPHWKCNLIIFTV